jgi:hypothetical protein
MRAALRMREKAMAIVPLTRQSIVYAGPAAVAEHRLKVQQQDRERAALRASELAAQMSPVRAAAERIRIWERLHALRLPSTSAHALIAVVAKQTHLTVCEVQAEQRRRCAGPAQAGAPTLEGDST